MNESEFRSEKLINIVFYYKQFHFFFVTFLYSIAVYVIYTKSSPSMQTFKRYLIVEHTMAYSLDVCVVITDIFPLFPLTGFQFREILCFPFLKPFLYPFLSVLVILCAVSVEACLRCRLFLLTDQKEKLSFRLLVFIAHSSTVLSPPVIAGPSYLGFVENDLAEKYFLKQYPSLRNSFPSSQISSFFVPSINPWIYGHVLGCLIGGPLLACELFYIIFTIFKILKREQSHMSAKTRNSHKKAVTCLLLQFFVPVVSMCPAILSGIGAVFLWPLPYKYLNPFIPLIFALNTTWIVPTTLYFTTTYKDFIISVITGKRQQTLTVTVTPSFFPTRSTYR